MKNGNAVEEAMHRVRNEKAKKKNAPGPGRSVRKSRGTLCAMARRPVSFGAFFFFCFAFLLLLSLLLCFFCFA